MSDEQVEKLKGLFASEVGRLYFHDTIDGVLIPIRGISDNHRDTSDPAEIPESVAWLANSPGKCVGLLGASVEEFKFLVEVKVDFPE